MSEQAGSQAKGSIYDLGYRRYEGIRLGRAQAIVALYVHSLRTCFGLGRRTGSKIIPIGLTVLVFTPAGIQLGVAAIFDENLEVVRAVTYFGWVQTILGLFAAAMAPELVGRDQRNRTLSLYFSRALTREDYALAKLAAMASAMLFLTLTPMSVLFIGTGLASDDLSGYFKDHLDQVPAIILSSIIISSVMATLALAVAAQTPRRAYATGTILGIFTVTWIIAGIITALAEGSTTGIALLFSPFWMLRGVAFWLFQAEYSSDSPLGYADLPGPLYGATALIYLGLTGYFFWRRIAKVAA